jgi:tRNA-splicing ligase RtcB
MQVAIIDDSTGPERSPRVFESEDVRADAEALRVLGEGTLDADLACPPVVLPDFHHKQSMEMPSSIAVATKATIRPTLSSASLNCGMALLALDVDRPGCAAIEDFYRLVKDRYPFPRRSRFELSASDVVRAATEGGRFAVDRFDVDDADLDRVEEGGRLDLEPFGGATGVREELPWSVVQLSRMRFGHVGPGNHFIELQEVEEILEPRTAEALGVAQGQLTIQYHNGGGVLPGELGALFARRKRAPLPLRAQMAIAKPLRHLASARSREEVGRRLNLYFSRQPAAVPRDGEEGRRLMLANAAGMNYGFAFRLSTYASFRAFAATAFGARNSRLIVDSPHNSIYEEDVDGERAIVHRHNACRAYPAGRMTGHPVFSRTGQPVLLPGTNRTSSFLCVAADGAGASLHSVSHGSGMVIKGFEQRGLSGPDPAGRSTLRFRYPSAAPQEVPHLDDRGVSETLRILTSNGLVRPVARMRPIAVLT